MIKDKHYVKCEVIDHESLFSTCYINCDCQADCADCPIKCDSCPEDCLVGGWLMEFDYNNKDYQYYIRNSEPFNLHNELDALGSLKSRPIAETYMCYHDSVKDTLEFEDPELRGFETAMFVFYGLWGICLLTIVIAYCMYYCNAPIPTEQEVQESVPISSVERESMGSVNMSFNYPPRQSFDTGVTPYDK